MHKHNEAVTEVFMGLQQALAALDRLPSSHKRFRIRVQVANAEAALNLLDEELEDIEKESLTC